MQNSYHTPTQHQIAKLTTDLLTENLKPGIGGASLQVTLRLPIPGRPSKTFYAYPKIYIGDFSNEEQSDALLHYSEITSIGFKSLNSKQTSYFPLQSISIINLRESRGFHFINTI